MKTRSCQAEAFQLAEDVGSEKKKSCRDSYEMSRNKTPATKGKVNQFRGSLTRIELNRVKAAGKLSLSGARVNNGPRYALNTSLVEHPPLKEIQNYLFRFFPSHFIPLSFPSDPI